MKYVVQKVSFIIVAIVIIQIFSANKVFASVLISDIPVSTTLDPSITYVIDGHYSVWSGATLTIPAGTNIVFTAGSVLDVKGKLVTKGTASDHVIFSTGEPSKPATLLVPAIISQDTASTADHSSDTETPDITPITIETPTVTTMEVSSESAETVPEAVPLDITNTVMLSANSIALSQHNGITFNTDSSGSFLYTDISDAATAITISSSANVTLEHVTINNSTTGISDSAGHLTLKDTSFTNVDTPVNLDVHSTFTHSNTLFSHTSIQGWEYSGSLLAGETFKMDSLDGEYYLTSLFADTKSTITISPGVTIFEKDGGGLQTKGSIKAVGTADTPIIFYGDGVCSSHTPAIQFLAGVDHVTLEHIRFRNLCNGLKGEVISDFSASYLDFDTIAGTVLDIANSGDISADHLTMENIYQAFKLVNGTALTTDNDTITGINTDGAAIDIQYGATLDITDTHITSAATCINLIGNASLIGARLQIQNCTKDAIYSNNAGTPNVSDITLTHSEIGYSGSALNLNKAIVIDVSNNNFHNDEKGVVLTNMPKTVLINNSWGSDTGPTIASNPLGTGTVITPTNVTEVVYRPWLGMGSTATEHTPIIIVPGITGSVLTKDYGDFSELWPNIAKLAIEQKDSFLNDLILLQGGTPSTVRPVKVGDIIRSAGDRDIFEGLIATLLQNGYREGVDLFVMPYDWRLSNTKNQSMLGDSITNALSTSGKSKVNIIAHSMGGLLVKEYLSSYTDTPIDHLFFVATPHLGAPKAFKALMYGDNMGFSVPVGSILSVDVLNPDRVKTITQNMPSVYELLPGKTYINSIGSYVTSLIGQPHSYDYTQTKNMMIQDGRNEKMFPFAEQLHDATDDLSLSQYSTYNFAACGATKTVGRILLTQEESFGPTGLKLVPETRFVYSAGDGIVPLESARAAIGAQTYYVANGSHGTLPSIAEVQSAITAVLNGKPVPTSTTLSTTANNCALSGDVVEVHSPVSLDIYDSQGKHTGLDDNGDIEHGIPNVEYEIVGDEKFAFLPDGETYTVVNHAQSTGSYDMYISHSDSNDTIGAETYFHRVPLNTIDAVGTVTITPSDDQYSIAMDQDGDGNIDSVIAPSSTLDQTKASDVTAPITTAETTDTTVTLHATDDVAGVLATSYSIDGTTWNDYTIPFTVADGTTISFLSVDNAGNVENIQYMTVAASQTTSVPTDQSDTSTNTSNSTQNQSPQTTDTGGGGGAGGSSALLNTGNSDIGQAVTNIADTSLVDQQDSKEDAAVQSGENEKTTPTILLDQKDTDIAEAVADDSIPSGTELLASATVVPTGNKTFYVILFAVIAALVAIAIHRFRRKKKSIFEQ